MEPFLIEPAAQPNSVYQTFELQARRFPQAIAVAAGELSHSYQDLDQLAANIAAALRRRGVGPGQIVMVGLPRSVESVASLLAVLKTGAAYCPLDLRDVPARRRSMCEDAQPKVILTLRRLAGLFDEASHLVLCVDELDALPESQLNCTSANVDENTPAALLFTSGSTGRPKGVLIPHRGILRLFFGTDYIPFGSGLRTMFHSPQHFDASTFEIWAPLLHGGCCAIFPDEGIPSLGLFAEAIPRFAVNCLFLGPALFNVIIDEQPQVLYGPRYILIGGEKMSVRHVRKAMDLFPATQFINMYGPTETTTFATTYPVPADFAADATSVPIGKPIAGTDCYLLNEQGDVVTDGDVGELFIGGAGVALGYLNRPELTATQFLPDKFSNDATARMYRTGDLCRRLPDGNLDFVGRLDGQLKIRSHRIELGEIEYQLLQSPAVSQAVVIPVEQAGQTYLAGYYTLDPGQLCTVEQLQEHLRAHLPTYLLPRSLTQVKQFPVTPSGKIDRAALPAPQFVAANKTTEPGTLREQQLLVIWQAVLANPAVGIDDSFFEMGGTSLDAIKLCLSVEKKTGMFVPISMLMGASTVRAFAKAMEKTESLLEPEVAVHLAGKGNGAPLYFIAGEVGHPLELRALALAIAGDRPIYGLQLAGMDGVTPLLDSIQSVAKYVLPTIRRLSGSRPIHLLGYCYGGLVAYELACLLEQSSLKVGQLLLVDSWTAASVVRKPLRRRIAIRLQRGPFQLTRQAFAALLGKTKMETAAHEGKLDRLIRQMQDANTAAYYKYKPGRYSGSFISIRAAQDDNDLYMSDTSGGWETVIGGPVQTHQSPGNHSSMIRPPHVDALARFVEQQLDGTVDE